MNIQYLEIVTTEVDAMCSQYAQIHSVSFGDPDPNLGNARTANLSNGGMLGVRAPLSDTEEPVIRPYMLVEDIESSVATAERAGAEIALAPTDLAGHGTCAIIIQCGIQTGLWQV